MSASNKRSKYLQEHHAELERTMNQVLSAVETAAHPTDVRPMWLAFEKGIRAHFRAEEEEIFPLMMASDEQKNETQALESEHVEILKEVEALGLQIDLHVARASAVGDLIAKLRAHAGREEKFMYKWADEKAELSMWERIELALEKLNESIPLKG
jgi:hemerythrin